ncbi:hypothetical protein FB451DRAFT_1180789 [Mycena latifolia]|nr:hypothetical protein FB451DRAFT_1180789 [Mycena latifolia]
MWIHYRHDGLGKEKENLTPGDTSSGENALPWVLIRSRDPSRTKCAGGISVFLPQIDNTVYEIPRREKAEALDAGIDGSRNSTRDSLATPQTLHHSATPMLQPATTSTSAHCVRASAALFHCSQGGVRIKIFEDDTTPQWGGNINSRLKIIGKSNKNNIFMPKQDDLIVDLGWGGVVPKFGGYWKKLYFFDEDTTMDDNPEVRPEGGGCKGGYVLVPRASHGSEDAYALGCFIFQEILCRLGAIAEIMTDSGSAWVKAVDWLLKEYHINHIRIYGYSSCANRPIKWPHFDVQEAISKACEGDLSVWMERIFYVFWAEWVSIQKSTGYCPYYFDHEVEPLFAFNIIEATYMVPATGEKLTTKLIGQRALQFMKRPGS